MKYQDVSDSRVVDFVSKDPVWDVDEVRNSAPTDPNRKPEHLKPRGIFIDCEPTFGQASRRESGPPPPVL